MRVLKGSKFGITGSNLEFLGSYLKFGSVIGFVPFQLQKNEFTGEYASERGPFLKIRCGLFYILTSLSWIRAWSDILHMNPAKPFRVGSALCGTVYTIIMLAIFPTKETTILKIFNGALDNELELTFKVKLKNESKSCFQRLRTTEALGKFTCGLCFIFAMSNTIIDNNWIDSDWELMSQQEVMYRVGVLAMQASYAIVAHFQDLLFVVMALVGTEAVDKYCEILGTDEDVTGEQVVKAYESMKSKIENLNAAFTNAIFFGVFGSVPYYAMCFSSILESFSVDSTLGMSIREQILVGLYFIIFGKTLLVSARINKKAGELGHWLSVGDNASKIPISKLSVILHELSAERIGLRGNNFFVISYSFVGSISGLVLTYSVVASQFK